MKKIVYMLALAAVLSCAGCSNNAESNAAEVQGTSSQTSSQPDVTSQPEESSIEVVAGDFAFKVPESAELSDNSEDGVIQLSYLIQSEGCEYSLSILSTSKENGQKLHNDFVNYLNNYAEEMVELAKAIGATGDVEFPDHSMEKENVDNIGGETVSLGTKWEFKSESYCFIALSCFVNDKYYTLEYHAESQSYDPAIWDDFLNNIRPL